MGESGQPNRASPRDADPEGPGARWTDTRDTAAAREGAGPLAPGPPVPQRRQLLLQVHVHLLKHLLGFDELLLGLQGRTGHCPLLGLCPSQPSPGQAPTKTCSPNLLPSSLGPRFWARQANLNVDNRVGHPRQPLCPYSQFQGAPRE